MRYLIFILLCSLVSVVGQAQSLSKDTVHFLFDKHNPDSMCEYQYSEGATIKKSLIKKHRKTVERDRKGNIERIYFYICDEMFIYSPGQHNLDTLSGVLFNRIALSSLEDAIHKLHLAERKLNVNAEKTQSIYIYPRHKLIQTYIIEELKNKKFLKYKTFWVEKSN